MIFAGIVGAGLVWGWLLVLFVDQRPQRTRTASEPESEADDNPSKLTQMFKLFLQKWQTERRPYLNLIAVAIFTLWFAWLVYQFTSATQLIFFFIALIIAFFVHFAWRQQLRQKQKI